MANLFSNESEQAVIGGLFVSPVSYDDVAERVSTGDFFKANHRAIFATMAKLATAGQPIDLVTVAEQMQADGTLDGAGGFAYLGTLARDTPSAANVIAYADIVRNRAKRRALIQLGTSLQQKAEESTDSSDVLAWLQQSIASLDTDTETGAVLLRDLLKSAVDVIDQRFHGVADQGASTGIQGLDERIIGLRAGLTYIIAGRPAMGKSVLGLQLGARVAAQENKPCLLFTLEMTAAEQAERLLSAFGPINVGTLRTGQLQEDDWPRLTNAVSRLCDAPLWIDETPGLSLDALLSRARRMHRKTPLGAIVVDHIGLIDHKSENRQQAVSDIARALKNLAKELQCPVIELVQLNRQVEQRQDKRPMLSDLRESGEIEQSADVVMMLYRDDYYYPDSIDAGCAELLLRKIRGGIPGMVPLAFIGGESRFAQLHGRLPSESMPKRQHRYAAGIDL